MKIDESEVERIAALAHLRFTLAERVRMSEEMSAILGYIDQIAEVEAPSSNDVEMPDSALSPDSVAPSLDRQVIEENAPRVIHGFFVVPRVIASGGK